MSLGDERVSLAEFKSAHEKNFTDIQVASAKGAGLAMQRIYDQIGRSALSQRQRIWSFITAGVTVVA
jgi:hypothetical protein